MSAPLPPVVGDRPNWLRRLRGVFTERLGTKFTAAVMSVLLWLIVSARLPTRSLVLVDVLPELDSSLILLDQPPRVRALVAGRGADLLKLHAAPPVVRRVVSADAPDTLLLDITPSDVQVPAELTNDVRVIDVQPRTVMLRFEPRATRRITVVDDGRILVRDASAIHAATGVRFEPAAVRVTGPRRFVRRLGSVRPFSLTIARGDTVPRVADLDTAGLGVRMQPSQVKVTVRWVP